MKRKYATYHAISDKDKIDCEILVWDNRDGYPRIKINGDGIRAHARFSTRSGVRLLNKLEKEDKDWAELFKTILKLWKRDRNQ
jgi:hypothetical protein